MPLHTWAAALPSRMAWPAGLGRMRSSSGCPGCTVGANPRAADDASRFAVALIRGVAGIPSGPERARECSVRRAEIVSGIKSVLRSLEASGQAFRAQSRLAGGWFPEVVLEHSKRLRWATSMTNALQTASRTLQTLDSCDGPELEYLQIAEQLSLIKKTLRDFSDMVSNLGEATPGQPPVKKEAAALCAPQAEKPESLSETCSTLSGERSGCCSETCSEDGCDTPRHCHCVDLEASAEAWPRACADLAAPSSGEEAFEECEAEKEGEELLLFTFRYDGLYWG